MHIIQNTTLTKFIPYPEFNIAEFLDSPMFESFGIKEDLANVLEEAEITGVYAKRLAETEYTYTESESVGAPIVDRTQNTSECIIFEYNLNGSPDTVAIYLSDSSAPFEGHNLLYNLKIESISRETKEFKKYC